MPGEGRQVSLSLGSASARSTHFFYGLQVEKRLGFQVIAGCSAVSAGVGSSRMHCDRV